MTNFELNQVVTHKASFERGVIVAIKETCKTHGWKGHMLFGAKQEGECVWERNDLYDISIGFKKVIENVSGSLIEIEESIDKGE